MFAAGEAATKAFPKALSNAPEVVNPTPFVVLKIGRCPTIVGVSGVV